MFCHVTLRSEGSLIGRAKALPLSSRVVFALFSYYQHESLDFSALNTIGIRVLESAPSIGIDERTFQNLLPDCY